MIQSIFSFSDIDGDSTPWYLHPFLVDICDLKDCFESLVIDFVCRDGNRAADWMAKMARGIFWFFDVPFQLVEILFSDVKGVALSIS